jgi:hypothetical protein
VYFLKIFCIKKVLKFSNAVAITQTSLSRAPILHCDNIGATLLTSNPIPYVCTKHIEIDYNFVGKHAYCSKGFGCSFLIK